MNKEQYRQLCNIFKAHEDWVAAERLKSVNRTVDEWNLVKCADLNKRLVNANMFLNFAEPADTEDIIPVPKLFQFPQPIMPQIPVLVNADIIEENKMFSQLAEAIDDDYPDFHTHEH